MAEVKTPFATKSLAWAGIVVAIVAAFLPLALTAIYALTGTDGTLSFSGFRLLSSFDPALLQSLWLTLVITFGTLLVLAVTLLPMLVVVHVWRPQWRTALETVCTLPLVVPSIALAAGLIAILRWGAQQGGGSIPNAISQAVVSPDFPVLLIGTYAVLCLPFTYRALDSGLRTLPLRTFFDASASLGGGTVRTLLRVVLPSIRRPAMYSAFFAVALSFGEYTIAATLNQRTFPVWLFTTSNQDFRSSVTLSLASTVLTWLLLILATVAAREGGGSRARRFRFRASGAAGPAAAAASSAAAAARSETSAPDPRRDALV